MRLCRIGPETKPRVAFYDESRIVPLTDAAVAYDRHTSHTVNLPESDHLVDFLPPSGPGYPSARAIANWIVDHPTVAIPGAMPTASVEILLPIPRPNKFFLLAGNYAEHVRERGGSAAERAQTFPYVFMKPPTTTLTPAGRPIQLPRIAPDAVDWELELAVIIGQRAKHVREADALSIVAGYTILNDISQRRFRPNPDRQKREKDTFFDWLHGKWFDSFAAMGAAVTSADAIPDPQNLAMRLDLNGVVRQDASTGQMVFPIAAIIEFISSICTLEPGDIISTGTPSGVGAATGTFLKPGDVMTATIEKIGTLRTPVVVEA